MPFDPKLILPDDAPLGATGDLQLPGDLAALAEQLGDDARHLAAVYPAHRSPAPPVAAQSRRIGRLGPAGLVAASLAALLLGLAALTPFLGSGRRAPTSVAVAAKAPDTSARTEAAVDRRPPNVSTSLRVPTVGTAISLTELSGPELEAVFDLWQRGEAEEQPGIAF